MAVDLSTVPDSELHSEVARRRAAKRIHHNGGRPRSDAPRCNCGRMTARLAHIKKHKC